MPSRAGLDEAGFIARLRAFACHPAARGLLDDAAVLVPPAGRALVLTTDLLVEGIHFLPNDPPADVAWKLLAVNLSDLAAKGAEPLGVLLGYPLGGGDRDAAFADGLGAALAYFGVPLLGGDTVAGHGSRTLSLIAIGAAPEGGAPSRAGARIGDAIWVSGTIGEAGIGLDRARRGVDADDPRVRRYRRPEPRLAAGQALAPLVTAMSDVSDGLLIDAGRLAAASGIGMTLDLDAVPVPAASDRAARLAAMTAGDDYELLFTAPAAATPAIVTLSQSRGVTLSPIGECVPGAGLRLRDAGGMVPLPERLGYEHAADDRGVGD